MPLYEHGFVGLVDTMGSDQSIERAARVSYGEGTRSTTDTRNLLRYLMKHRHTSPFEMGEVQFHLKIPIFVMRQLVRHRTASLNEYSARYSVLSDEHYHPDNSYVKAQSKTNKQGSDGDISNEAKVHWRESCIVNRQQSRQTYDAALDAGISRELARINLPVSIYTELYWKIDVNNFMKTMSLRLDPHAQREIRDFAWAMYDLASPHFPLTFEAFEDYMLNATHLSIMETEALQDVLYGFLDPGAIAVDEVQSEECREKYGMGKREWTAFVEKWFASVPGIKALKAAAKDYKQAVADGSLRIENPNPKPYGGPF
jgi:thymidylate synthase (FAD)